jgi:hypothetical protein
MNYNDYNQLNNLYTEGIISDLKKTAMVGGAVIATLAIAIVDGKRVIENYMSGNPIVKKINFTKNTLDNRDQSLKAIQFLHKHSQDHKFAPDSEYMKAVDSIKQKYGSDSEFRYYINQISTQQSKIPN